MASVLSALRCEQLLLLVSYYFSSLQSFPNQMYITYLILSLVVILGDAARMPVDRRDGFTLGSGDEALTQERRRLCII
jgi:hypothetical protein